MDYCKRIDALSMQAESKEGYKWLFSNFDAIQRQIEKKNPTTIRATRDICKKEIGFMPAILFSFKHLFESKEIYIKALEEQF